MSKTEWLVDGDNDAALDLDGRRYASGDSGAPMLCSLLCKTMGRHVHVAGCRAEDPEQCFGEGIEHVQRNEGAEAQEELDWITHRLFWARSGEYHITNEKRSHVQIHVRIQGWALMRMNRILSHLDMIRSIYQHRASRI
jgi:hypothetical protein